MENITSIGQTLVIAITVYLMVSILATLPINKF